LSANVLQVNDAGFREHYARATEIRTGLMAEKRQEISGDESND